MKKIIRLLLLVILGTSLLEGSVGKITAINGKATLERASSSVSAALGSSLEAKDTIVTTKEAKAQLTFNDNTIITVGKQSTFSVEEYLFDATPSSTTKFTMLNGTIRVLSGKIGKIAPEKFALKTKTATIGIRGTDFIAHVSPQGEGPIFCMQGSISVRTHDNNESNLTSQLRIVPAGSFVSVSSTGSVSDVKEFTTEDISHLLRTEFGVSETIKTANADTPVEFTFQSSPTLNPDESIDRGSGVNIENTVTEIGSSITTNTLNNALPNVVALTPPQTFAGFTSYIIRAQDASNVSLNNGEVSLTSTPETQSVTGSIIDNYLEMRIDLGSTNSYAAVDEFDIKLASISSPGPSGALTSSSHLWSTSDTQNDYFSWGEWEIVPDPATSDEIFHGYWAAGVETPVSLIDGFRTAEASMSYTGTVIGEVVTTNVMDGGFSSVAISNGVIDMSVDFGLDSFSTDVTANEYILRYSGEILTNKLNGTLTMFANIYEDFFNTESGTIKGAFYGSTGQTAGGTFSAQANTSGLPGDTIMIQGAFKATAP